MGRAHCLELARRGARVIVNDTGAGMGGDGEDFSIAEQVVTEVRSLGGEAVASLSSVATAAGAENMVACALDNFGRLDAVIHNAGIVGFAPVHEMSLEDYRRVVSVHLEGGFLIARAAWPHMARQRYGRLVFITSQAALSGLPNLAHYGSAKAGLTGLSRVLALEGVEVGIRSNCLGVTAMTRMMEDYFTPADPNRPDVLRETSAWWERFNRSELVSPVVAYLAHENCALNGEILDTGGGHVSRQYLATTEGFLDLELTAEDVERNIERINDCAGAHDAFRDAPHFLEWRNAKLIENGATFSDADIYRETHQ